MEEEYPIDLSDYINLEVFSEEDLEFLRKGIELNDVYHVYKVYNGDPVEGIYYVKKE